MIPSFNKSIWVSIPFLIGRLSFLLSCVSCFTVYGLNWILVVLIKQRLLRLHWVLLFVIIAIKEKNCWKDHAANVAALRIEIDILLPCRESKRPIIFCIQRIIRSLIDMRDKETYTRNAVANYRTATVQGWSTKIKDPSSEDGAKATAAAAAVGGDEDARTMSRRLPLIGSTRLMATSPRLDSVRLGCAFCLHIEW